MENVSVLNKVLLVFPGLGKTYAAGQTDRILEIQLSQFKNVNLKKFCDHFPEHLKGNFEVPFELDPDFPNNVLSAICEGFKDGRIPVMALKTSNIEFVLENGLDFDFVMPDKDKYDELKEQYEKRGNTKEYVERNMGMIERVEEDIKKYGKNIYYINKGEHLLHLVNRLLDL